MGKTGLQVLYGTQLVPIKQATALLAQETDVRKVAEFSKLVEAAKMIDANNTQRRNYWGELGIWSSKRLGELIAQGQKNGKIASQGGDRKSKGHRVPLILAEVFDTTQDNAKAISKRSKKLLTISDKTIRDYVKQEPKAGGEVGKAGLLRWVADILKQARRDNQAEKEAAAAMAAGDSDQWTVTKAQKVIPCSVLITDPPYGILKETWEPDDLEKMTRKWLTRWRDCGAELILSFFSQRYMWHGRNWFDECLEGYTFQQLLVWHYPNNKSPQSRKGFKQTWEPVFFYRRDDSDRQIGVGGTEWGEGLNDFDCHVAAVPQSNFNEADRKVHPAQKPVSVMRWLINATSDQGDLIADPFCGSGTTGIAALQLGRRFHGIENDGEIIKMARQRIKAYGRLQQP